MVEAEIKEATQEPELKQQLEMVAYRANIERIVTLSVKAYDWNCPQHITPRYTLDEIEALTE